MARFLRQALGPIWLIAGEVSHRGPKTRREQNENAETLKI